MSNQIDVIAEMDKIIPVLPTPPISSDMGPAIIQGYLSPRPIFDVKEEDDPDVKNGKRKSILADLELN